MKKSLYYVGCMAILLSLAGCQDNSGELITVTGDPEKPSVDNPSDPGNDVEPGTSPEAVPESPDILCDKDGQNVVSCIHDECSLVKACPNGCENSECRAEVCGLAGGKRCDVDGQNVEICTESGAWIVDEVCADGCDDATNACRDVCDDGAVRCAKDGQKTQKCQNQQWVDDENCAGGCQDGACVTSCPAQGEMSCQGDNLVQCGQAWETVEECEFGCDAALKRCKPDCRIAGETVCSDSGKLRTCQSDFTWAESNCEFGCYTNADGMGLCRPECANAGDVRCKGEGIETCSSDYHWVVTTEKCEAGCSSGSCNQCKPGAVSCNANGNEQTCQNNSTWKETKQCTNGCLNGACKGCKTVGELSCSADGHVQTCQSDGSYKITKTCDNGCFAKDSTAYCITCTDIGGAGCSGKNILTCTDYHLVKTDTCEIGCRRYAGSNAYCTECAAEGTSCSDDGKSLVTCESTLKLKTTPCENGCFNGKCKECPVSGQLSCTSDGNVQKCSTGYVNSVVQKCAHGCSGGSCNECSTASHCTELGGWKAGTCAGSECRASSCATGYVLQSNTCTYPMPFAGNVFVTAMDGDIVTNAASIILQRESTINAWKSKSAVLSYFFAPKNTGSMKLFIKAALPSGVKNSTISFTYEGVTHSVTLNSTTMKVYSVGSWNVTKSGYVKIDMKGTDVNPSGAVFANIDSFYVGGSVVKSKPVCTTMEAVGDAYWHRRGPSVHLNYTMPSGNVEWFYNEVTVPASADVVGSYFMLTGFSEGYMGIQVNSATKRQVLFSVWSGYTTDDPNQIPKDYQVTTLRKGTGVTAQPFGNEGSGMQSFMPFDWKAGKTYKTLVHIKPTGTGSTDYTGYFCDETGKWYLLASFRRPKITTWYKGAHSFLENFIPEASIYSRQVQFTNQWMRTDKGVWSEVTEAKFTCDGTGLNGFRSDMRGYVSGKNFVLKNCGHTAETTAYGTKLTRASSGTAAPNIDFAALEKLK